MPLRDTGLFRAVDCFHQMQELDSLVNQPPESRPLLAFWQLACIGSFTGAARALQLSQSEVSRSIKALEEAVGCRLFDRLGKKVALTQAGKQLLHHAQKILARWKPRAVRSAGWGSGGVAGCGWTRAPRRVSTSFRRAGMEVNTVIEVGSMEATKELVKLGPA
jgi:hypothetical protein